MVWRKKNAHMYAPSNTSSYQYLPELLPTNPFIAKVSNMWSCWWLKFIVILVDWWKVLGLNEHSKTHYIPLSNNNSGYCYYDHNCGVSCGGFDCCCEIEIINEKFNGNINKSISCIQKLLKLQLTTFFPSLQLLFAGVKHSRIKKFANFACYRVSFDPFRSHTRFRLWFPF